VSKTLSHKLNRKTSLPKAPKPKAQSLFSMSTVHCQKLYVKSSMSEALCQKLKAQSQEPKAKSLKLNT
jgi:hypothetical protein